MTDFDKNLIFSPGSCGHFALGTLSGTYLKDAVFEINVKQKIANFSKIQNVKFDIKIKNGTRTRYCFVSINTFGYIISCSSIQIRIKLEKRMNEC